MPPFLTTHVGSLPHTQVDSLCARLTRLLDAPAWPQLPRRSFRESMYAQFSAGLPRLVVDEAHEKITFDTRGDLSADLESFYARYLADDVESFAPSPAYAIGFCQMLAALKAAPGEWAKGQVTGPISFGLTVTDQDRRASLYDERLADAIVKNAAMVARWQTRRLKSARPNTIVFVDEPYMAAFGSAYINLSCEQAVAMLDEVFDAIHAEGGLAGVHCCANTDWSVLLATAVDILNLDAWGYLDNLALYPAEVRAFLDRGGRIAWGSVPNDEAIFTSSAGQIAQRLRQGFDRIHHRAGLRGIGICPDELAERSFLTPRCGLGSTTVEVAERAMESLAQTAEVLRRG